jgi:hypothetical protein
MRGDFRDDARRFEDIDKAAQARAEAVIDEVNSIAYTFAVAGIDPVSGTALPELISSDANRWINNNLDKFRLKVKDYRRGIEQMTRSNI